MKKILILGYYELKCHMLAIRESLLKYNYLVDDYPLFRYAYDRYDKIENYQEHLDEYIKKTEPDIILWWFCDVPVNVFDYIKNNNKHIQFIVYNCDDPLNFNASLINKYKIFDIILTTCEENIIKYKINCNAKEVLFVPYSFDPSFFYELEEIDADFECDISVICHNMFPQEHYPNQVIDRKVLYDGISSYCNDNNKKFHIYGPPVIKELYPSNYKGDINYMDEIKLYNSSKINIVTHPVCNKKNPITDIEMKILGSSGLLLTDKCKGFKRFFDKSCIFMKTDDYVNQIDHILNNYSEYTHIKKLASQFANQYTWDNFVTKMHTSVAKINFDPIFYKILYDIGDIDPWEHWLNTGINNNYYYCEFSVPSYVDCEQYAEDNNLNIDNKHKVYLHWVNNGKPDMYILNSQKKSRGITLSSDKINISTSQLYDFFSVFNKINGSTLDDGLDELRILCKNNPRVKVNKILEHYFSSI